jgi:hypothetical protein
MMKRSFVLDEGNSDWEECARTGAAQREDSVRNKK